MTYKEPNYTQVPNLLLDEHMKNMDKAELKIVLLACRKTFGWRKERDRISYTQFEKLTGLSRASVQTGILKAIGRGVLERFACDNGFEYSLVIDEAIPKFEPLAIPTVEHTKDIQLKKTAGQRIGFPENVAEHVAVFMNHFPSIVVDSKAKWIKQAKVWLTMGLVPEDIEKMCAYAQANYEGVAQPASITSAYNMMKSQQNKSNDYEEKNRELKALHG